MVPCPFGPPNQEPVKVVPSRGGGRVQLVWFQGWRERKNCNGYSISLSPTQFPGMIIPQTHCSTFEDCKDQNKCCVFQLMRLLLESLQRKSNHVPALASKIGGHWKYWGSAPLKYLLIFNLIYSTPLHSTPRHCPPLSSILLYPIYPIPLLAIALDQWTGESSLSCRSKFKWKARSFFLLETD